MIAESDRAPDRPELAFSALVLHEAIGTTRTPNHGLSPDQEQRATRMLFELLSEFLADDGFEKRWARAEQHLLRAVAEVKLREDTHRMVQDSLARGWLIVAFKWLVWEAADADARWTPELHEALRGAAEAMNQESWPDWTEALINRREG